MKYLYIGMSQFSKRCSAGNESYTDICLSCKACYNDEQFNKRKRSLEEALGMEVDYTQIRVPIIIPIDLFKKRNVRQ